MYILQTLMHFVQNVFYWLGTFIIVFVSENMIQHVTKQMSSSFAHLSCWKCSRTSAQTCEWERLIGCVFYCVRVKAGHSTPSSVEMFKLNCLYESKPKMILQ